MIYQKCYKKILNNFLDDLYLYVLMQVNSKTIATQILFHSFEKAFLFNNSINNIHNIIKKECNKLIKECDRKMYIQEKYDEGIPDLIYKLNFNIHIFFNETDNFIYTNMVVYNRAIDEIIKISNLNYDEILTSINKMFPFIKKMFINFNK